MCSVGRLHALIPHPSATVPLRQQRPLRITRYPQPVPVARLPAVCTTHTATLSLPTDKPPYAQQCRRRFLSSATWRTGNQIPISLTAAARSTPCLSTRCSSPH